MIIRRLRLENFRKYAVFDQEFPEGLIGIIGDNGSGKTTLFEALAFALYGTMASRTKSKGIRRDGAAPNAVCRVELEFAYLGETYRVVRELRGLNETQSAEICGGTGALLASRASGVEAFTRRLLGMDHATFIRSIFARQKEVAVLTDDKPEERRRAIRRMMGIERVEKAVKQVREDKRSKEDFVRGAELSMAGLDDQIGERQKLAPQLKTAERTYQKLDQKAQKHRVVVQMAQQAFREQEQLQSRFTAIEKQISNADTAIDGLTTRQNDAVQKLKTLKQSRGELQKLRPQLREYQQVKRLKAQFDQAQGAFNERQQLETEILELSTTWQQLKTEVATKQTELTGYTGLDRKIGKIIGDVAATERIMAKTRKALKALRAKLDGKKALIRQLKESLQRLGEEGQEGRCPTCLRPLTGSFEDVQAHFAEERTALEQAKNELKIQVDKQEAEESSANAKLTALRKEQNRLQQQQRSRDSLKAKQDGARRQMQDKRATLIAKQSRQRTLRKVKYDAVAHKQARRQLAELQPVYDRTQRLEQDVSQIDGELERLKQFQAQLTEKRTARTNLLTQRKEMAFSSKNYEKARDAYEAANKALDEIRTKESDARSQYQALKSRVAQLTEDIHQKQAMKKKIEADQRTIQYLAQLEVMLKDFQTALINRIRPLLADRSSILLDQITEGRYSRVELDEDYQLMLVDNGRPYPIRRFSGGEEDLANLCLRIAISQTLAELVSGSGWGTIALDEVFGSQDRNRRERLLRALQNLTGSFRQIFFITHLEDLQDRVQFALQISEDVNGVAVAQWAK